MTLVWVTLMVGLGVLFGMAALVIDLGFGFVQVRAMQNGADAGAIAATKLLAENVSAGGGGAIVYTVSNGEVHQRAELFASLNRPVPAALSIPDLLDQVLPRRAYAAPHPQGKPPPKPTTTPVSTSTPTPTVGPTPTPAPTMGYTLAVQYRPCPTPTDADPPPPAGEPNFSFDSDPTIVQAVSVQVPGSSRQADASEFVPGWTCSLRVYARVMHASMFSAAIGNPTMTEISRATVRIFPASPPTEVSNVWPITRWVCNGLDDPTTTGNGQDESNDLDDVTTDGADDCDDDELDTTDEAGTGPPDGIIDLPCIQDPAPPVEPCTFWSSGSEPKNTSWKHYVDFSRFSGLAKEEGIKRASMLEGWADTCDEVGPEYCPDLEYDPAATGSPPEFPDPPGNSSAGGGHNNPAPHDDIEHWIRHGWKGKLRANPLDCANVVNKQFDATDTPSTVTDPNQCPNSRIEITNGNLGNNLASAMEFYLDGHIDGNDVDRCGFPNAADNDYATVTVFVWRWGEQDTATSPENDSIALTNQSKLWGYYQSNASDFGITNSDGNVKRVIVARAARFRFCRGHIGSGAGAGGNSQVKGFFVSWTNFDDPPVCPMEPCIPSPVANTIALTD